MKSTLQLKQGLSHSFNFELQQAISLLTLPIIELKQHVDTILDNNPLLEFEDNLVQDSLLYTRSSTPANAEMLQDIEDIRPYTIKTRLFWQLELSRWPERELTIGAYLIDAMNDDGELEMSLSDIQSSMPTQYKSSITDIIEILGHISQFDKTPLYEKTMDYCIPDLLIQKNNGTYEVCLNMDLIPQLKLVSRYSGSIKHSGSAHDKQFIRNALKEAHWLLKALQVRQQHLLKIGQSIIQYQYDFLEHGIESMQPLHYHVLASDMNVHESTISRLVSHKLILTPRGLFELKYFFGNGTQPMYAMMKKLFSEEHHLYPLSDAQMTQLLLSRGFKATRRTVAKYRQAMAIPSSYHRHKKGEFHGNSNHRP